MPQYKSPAFQFYPKQWVGDNNIMMMDWDVQGMHVHLMSISWQEDQPATLPKSDKILRKLLKNIPKKDWENRIKPQLFLSWKTWEEDDSRIINNGLRREFIKQKSKSDKARTNANSRWTKDANASPQHMLENALLNKEVEIEEEVKVLTKSIEPSWKEEKQEAFEKRWISYPGKKDGKKKANGHWNTSIKTKADIEKYDQAVEAYATDVRHQRNDGFRSLSFKNGGTWFNNWQDWIPRGEYVEPEKPIITPAPPKPRTPVDPDLDSLWTDCKQRIREQVSDEMYTTWFGDIHPRILADGKLEVAVPNQITRKTMIENYRGLLENTLQAIRGSPVLVDFHIGT